MPLNTSFLPIEMHLICLYFTVLVNMRVYAPKRNGGHFHIPIKSVCLSIPHCLLASSDSLGRQRHYLLKAEHLEC